MHTRDRHAILGPNFGIGGVPAEVEPQFVEVESEYKSNAAECSDAASIGVWKLESVRCIGGKARLNMIKAAKQEPSTVSCGY